MDCIINKIILLKWFRFNKSNRKQKIKSTHVHITHVLHYTKMI